MTSSNDGGPDATAAAPSLSRTWLVALGAVPALLLLVLPVRMLVEGEVGREQVMSVLLEAAVRGRGVDEVRLERGFPDRAWGRALEAHALDREFVEELARRIASVPEGAPRQPAATPRSAPGP